MVSGQTLVPFKTELLVLTDASREGWEAHVNHNGICDMASIKGIPPYKLAIIVGNKTSPGGLQGRPEGQACLSYVQEQIRCCVHQQARRNTIQDIVLSHQSHMSVVSFYEHQSD